MTVLSKMTVLVDNQMTLLITLLAPHVNVIPFEGRTTGIESISALRDNILTTKASALIVRSTTIVNALLLQGTPIRFVATATAGTDHVDTDYLRAENITFTSAPGSNANAVADYVMLAIDEWLNVKRLNVDRRDVGTRVSEPPHALTLGIVGYGNVGRRVAHHARAAGFRILVYDPPLYDPKPVKSTADQGPVVSDRQFVLGLSVVSDLQSLITSSDIVTLHVPLTRVGTYPTAGMINANHIEALKTDALFINTSRGGIVDEAALKKRLETREIESVLDVYDNEPSINPDLASLALLATPHVAGYTTEAKINVARVAGMALLQWLEVDADGFERDLDAASDKNLEVRNLSEDHLWMREALRNKNPAEVFDLLRKSYVLKRERLSDPFSRQ